MISGVIGAGITLAALKDFGFAKAIILLFAPVGGLFGAGVGMGLLRMFFNSQKKKLSRVTRIVSERLNRGEQERIVIEEDAYSSASESGQESISKLKN